jgi:8-oxo-dGTP pyrophosphatase MutT (NUDIX family)
MNKYPDVTVKIIFRWKSQALIFRHQNGIFDFPGGRVKFGESLIGALKRELKEELNYSLNQEPIFFDIWNYISKNKKRHSVFITYIFQLSTKPKLSSPENLQILWLTKRDFIKRKAVKNIDFLNRIFKWPKIAK